jgi:NADH-quinone oxidoreductase subunit J
MLMYFLIISIIVQGVFIITSKNAIKSVLFLVSTYVLTSICFLILGAEFIAILLAIVYIGAIAILFLFVIMMLNLRILEVYSSRVSYLPIGLFTIIIFLVEVLYLGCSDLGSDLSEPYNPLYANYISNWALFEYGNYTNMQVLAHVLYNRYPHFVIFSAFILLLAMLGSIILTVGIGEKRISVQDFTLYTRRGDLRLKYWRI